MTAPQRLTDLGIKALLKQARTAEEEVPDGSVAGLFLRLSPAGSSTWTQIIRVTGEGGTNAHGKKLLGKRHRVPLGHYPVITLEAARAQANIYLAQAKRGINPKDAVKAAATAGTLTIASLSTVFMDEYVRSKELDSVALYEGAFSVHILPQVGEVLAELLSREDARKVMSAARVKRPNPSGRRGSTIGGVEAARTAVRVLRHMFTWAIDEEKLSRVDNPCRNLAKNLPKAKKGEVVLSLREARIVWQAAKDCGFPFGSQAQTMLVTGCRLDEVASAQAPWIDLDEALMVVPSEDYKSDHVHVIPLVSQAANLFRGLPTPRKGPYLFSSTDGRIPIRGVAKFFKTRLAAQIIANTGAPLGKRLTSHVLRRTVATRLAQLLGDEGDKLVKRVLGHSDGSVTALYNHYGYVREMRRALELWANELTSQIEPVSAGLPTAFPQTACDPDAQQDVSMAA